MLSDRERKTLHEVERHWMAEGPGFVAAVEVVGPRDSRYSVQWAYDLTRSAYMTAMVVAVGLVVATSPPRDRAHHGIDEPHDPRPVDAGRTRGIAAVRRSEVGRGGR